MLNLFLHLNTTHLNPIPAPAGTKRLSAGITNENAEVRFDAIEKEHAALRVSDPEEFPQTGKGFFVTFLASKK